MALEGLYETRMRRVVLVVGASRSRVTGVLWLQRDPPLPLASSGDS